MSIIITLTLLTTDHLHAFHAFVHFMQIQLNKNQHIKSMLNDITDEEIYKIMVVFNDNTNKRHITKFQTLINNFYRLVLPVRDELTIALSDEEMPTIISPKVAVGEEIASHDANTESVNEITTESVNEVATESVMSTGITFNSDIQENNIEELLFNRIMRLVHDNNIDTEISEVSVRNAISTYCTAHYIDSMLRVSEEILKSLIVFRCANEYNAVISDINDMSLTHIATQFLSIVNDFANRDDQEETTETETETEDVTEEQQIEAITFMLNNYDLPTDSINSVINEFDEGARPTTNRETLKRYILQSLQTQLNERHCTFTNEINDIIEARNVLSSMRSTTAPEPRNVLGTSVSVARALSELPESIRTQISSTIICDFIMANNLLTSITSVKIALRYIPKQQHPTNFVLRNEINELLNSSGAIRYISTDFVLASNYTRSVNDTAYGHVFNAMKVYLVDRGFIDTDVIGDLETAILVVRTALSPAAVRDATNSTITIASIENFVATTLDRQQTGMSITRRGISNIALFIMHNNLNLVPLSIQLARAYIAREQVYGNRPTPEQENSATTTDNIPTNTNTNTNTNTDILNWNTIINNNIAERNWAINDNSINNIPIYNPLVPRQQSNDTEGETNEMNDSVDQTSPVDPVGPVNPISLTDVTVAIDEEEGEV